MFQSLLSNLLPEASMPVLPAALALRWAQPVLWALVLGGLTLTLLRPLGARVQRSAAALVLLWTFLPGPVSPAYWLGLAFQLPSLSGAALCLYLGHRAWRLRGSGADAALSSDGPAGVFWSVAAVLLGWILLLDTFAVWPMSVYASGFGMRALSLALLLASIPWLVGAAYWRGAAMAAALLALYVMTRLPSGNLWDALLDPWLWLALQLRLVQLLVRWLTWRFRVGAEATTRA